LASGGYYLRLVFVDLDRWQLEFLSYRHLAWAILLGATEKPLLYVLLKLNVLPCHTLKFSILGFE
jgi:hypothetical protein